MNDLIYTSCIPVDAVAANTLRGGFEYKHSKNIVIHHSDTFKNKEPDNGQKKEIESYIGIRFGRFTVVGYHGTVKNTKKSQHAMFNVKCDCGKYETRRSRAIRNPRNHVDMCSECRQVEHVKDRDYFNRTGKDRR